MKGQTEEFGIAVVLGVLLLGLVLGAVNGSLVVLTRVPDIVVTLAMSFVWAGGALLVLQDAGRRLGRLAEGPRPRLAGQRVDPQGGDRPGRHRGRRLDPAPALQARALDLRDRQQPAGRVPERRLRRPDEDRSPTPSWACSPALGGLVAHREHRHRDARSRAVHADERRRGRPRRRQPRRRPRRRLRADRGRRHPPADPDRHDVPQRRPEPRGRRARESSSSAWSWSAASSQLRRSRA